jgi:hypothetical protein
VVDVLGYVGAVDLARGYLFIIVATSCGTRPKSRPGYAGLNTRAILTADDTTIAEPITTVYATIIIPCDPSVTGDTRIVRSACIAIGIPWLGGTLARPLVAVAATRTNDRKLWL